MLQTATASNYQPLTARYVSNSFEKQATHDLSALYPQSVLKSSDATGWQNVRAIHFRHSSKEVLIPASDDHCMVLNLGIPFFTQIYPGKRRFEGRLLSGEVAII